MTRTLRFPTMALPAALLLAACAAGTPGAPPAAPLSVAYAPPAATGLPAGYFRVPGTSQRDAVLGAADRLRAAGLTVARIDRRLGTITGSASDTGLVDCGTLTVREGAARRPFPANAALSVLPADGSDGTQFTERQVTARTTYRVFVAPLSDGSGYAARAETGHEVVVRSRPLAAERATETARLSFAGSAVETATGGLTCTGSAALADILAGR